MPKNLSLKILQNKLKIFLSLYNLRFVQELWDEEWWIDGKCQIKIFWGGWELAVQQTRLGRLQEELQFPNMDFQKFTFAFQRSHLKFARSYDICNGNISWNSFPIQSPSIAAPLNTDTNIHC